MYVNFNTLSLFNNYFILFLIMTLFAVGQLLTIKLKCTMNGFLLFSKTFEAVKSLCIDMCSHS